MSTDVRTEATSPSSKVKKSKLKDDAVKSTSKKRKHLHQDDIQSTPNANASPSKERRKRKHAETAESHQTPDVDEKRKKPKKKHSSTADELQHGLGRDSTPPSIFGPQESRELIPEKSSKKKKRKSEVRQITEEAYSQPETNGRLTSPHVAEDTLAEADSALEQDASVRKKEKRKKKKHTSTDESNPASEPNGNLPLSLPQGTSPQGVPEITKQERRARKEEKKRKRQSALEEDSTTNVKINPPQPDSAAVSSPQTQPTEPSNLQNVSQPSPETQKQGVNQNERSPFFNLTTSLYLPLPPIGFPKPLESLCADHLSSNLLTYFYPVDGVLLAYHNPRLQQSRSTGTTSELAMTHAEYATPYTWLTADFTVFRPERGSWLEGHVSVQNSSYIGLVCYNFFNASIIKERLPDGWGWKQGADDTAGAVNGSYATAPSEGHWVNERGESVEGLLKFRVRDYEALPSGYGRDKGFVSIDGTLLDVDIEERTERRIREGRESSQDSNKRGALGRRLKGALKSSRPKISDEANPYGKMDDANI